MHVSPTAGIIRAVDGAVQRDIERVDWSRVHAPFLHRFRQFRATLARTQAA